MNLPLDGTSAADPQYFGICFSSILYGITCSQTFNYYRSTRARSDNRLIKSLVAIVWSVFSRILDTVQQSVLMHLCYYYFIVGHSNNINVLLDANLWSAPVEVILSNVIGALVQSYQVYRVQIIGENVWVSAPCALLVVAALVFPIKILTQPDPIFVPTMLKVYFVAAASASSAADTIIAMLLVFYLYRKRTGLRRSNDIISRLIILAVSTGGLTAGMSLITLVALFTFPASSDYDLMLNFMMSKLYANALLAMLNTRDLIRGDSHPIKAIGLSDIHLSIPSTRSRVENSDSSQLQGDFIQEVMTVDSERSRVMDIGGEFP
ncbi:hypothetical protein NM688_g4653 [Phlebia brevispora]|uniref:Uncharacterized protein n=1 Tax=Phlebia brevispora TaxID=194682 RepID=A0ACC1T2Y0_9APHY|nr:hypothetical protein NM688_g4653 [Phlebia brevispora]